MTTAAGMVIVGAGECGARAAVTLRETGYCGSINLIGDEAHLPYERPPLSKETIISPAPVSRTILDQDRLNELEIDFVAGARVAAIDAGNKYVRLEDQRELSFDRLLIATGAAPRQLPGLPPSSRVFYLRSFNDALALRSKLATSRRVTVVGGGFIGLEVAATARRLGAEVLLLETNARLMMRAVPAEIADVVLSKHLDQGVDVRLGVSIKSIAADDDVVEVTLADGSMERADIVIIGIGAVPVTDLAASCGLRIDNGIAVDGRLRTSAPDVFAAGDCCSFPHALYDDRRFRLEAWRNAQDQGAVAARNMLGADECYAAVPWMWSDQFDLTLMIAGLPGEGATTVRRALGDGAFLLFFLAADGRLVGASGVGPGNSVAKDIRLAEMLIARRARPPVERLASDAFKLKALLAEAA